MDNVRIKELLEKHGLRKTAIRADVLAMLFEKAFALSHGDFESVFGSKYDRVTIYRTLNSFEDKGIIHKVPDDSGVQKYALCHDQCNSHQHLDEHVHFYCNTCGHTFCIDEVIVPSISLPKGYKTESYSFTVYGKCKNCNTP